MSNSNVKIEQTTKQIEQLQEKLKAEQEALEKKKRDAEKIEQMHKSIEEFQASAKRHEDAVKDYFAKINDDYPNQYKLKTEVKNKSFKAYNYLGMDIDDEILASKEVEYQYTVIQFKKNPEVYIEVKVHTVYRRNSFHGTNEGYKMFINGLDWEYERRAYSRPKGIHKRITQALQEREAKRVAAQQKASAYEKAVENTKQKYPEAEVKRDSIYKFQHRGRGYTIELVKATFKNGLKVYFGFNNQTGDIYKYKVDTSALETDDLISKLAAVKSKQS